MFISGCSVSISYVVVLQIQSRANCGSSVANSAVVVRRAQYKSTGRGESHKCCRLADWADWRPTSNGIQADVQCQPCRQGTSRVSLSQMLWRFGAVHMWMLCAGVVVVWPVLTGDQKLYGAINPCEAECDVSLHCCVNMSCMDNPMPIKSDCLPSFRVSVCHCWLIEPQLQSPSHVHLHDFLLLISTMHMQCVQELELNMIYK